MKISMKMKLDMGYTGEALPWRVTVLAMRRRLAVRARTATQSRDERLARARDLGASEILSKPFAPDALLHALHAA